MFRIPPTVPYETNPNGLARSVSSNLSAKACRVTSKSITIESSIHARNRSPVTASRNPYHRPC